MCVRACLRAHMCVRAYVWACHHVFDGVVEQLASGRLVEVSHHPEGDGTDEAVICQQQQQQKQERKTVDEVMATTGPIRGGA